MSVSLSCSGCSVIYLAIRVDQALMEEHSAIADGCFGHVGCALSRDRNQVWEEITQAEVVNVEKVRRSFVRSRPRLK